MTILGQENVQLLIGYQKENTYRQAFNQLAMNIFDLSFEDWYQAGYWNDKYIPYTLFKDDQAIANVSVNVIDFDLLGNTTRAIQIGTVMTAEEHRNKGLNRLLMEQVLKDWSNAAAFIYLYANPSVLELYPKFGFSRAYEYVHFCTIDHVPHNTSPYEKLDMTKQKDRDLLYHYVKNSARYSKIAMHDNNDLVMFYATSLLKDNIYYLPTEEVISIATMDGKTLNLWDVFGLQCLELDKIISMIAPPSIKEVSFGFTPIDCSAYQVKPLVGEDTLFIKSKQKSILDTELLMFPLLSHA